MKAEYGKYYILDSEKFYWCIQLQRKVRFLAPLVIKCDSGYGSGGHFGYLVDTNMSGPIYDTNNEIEFGDEDVIDEFNQKTDPLLYYDIMINNLAKVDDKAKNIYFKSVENNKELLNKFKFS